LPVDKDIRYVKDQEHGGENANEQGIGRAHVLFAQIGIPQGNRLGQLVSQSVAQADIEKTEPAEYGGQRQPNAVFFLGEIIQQKGNINEPDQDADASQQE